MKGLSTTERFWQHVDKSSSCWIWIGTILGNGYGQMKIDGRKHLAHRVSWQLNQGQIPEGLLVLHKCDNRPCVNPDHLFLGTHADNNQDARNKGRAKGAKAGEQHHNAKLSDFHIRNIRFLKSIGIKQITLARVYGVSPQHISKIVNRQERK